MAINWEYSLPFIISDILHWINRISRIILKTSKIQ